MDDIRIDIVGRVTVLTKTDLMTMTVQEMLQEAKDHPELWNIQFKKVTRKLQDSMEEYKP